MKEPNYDDLTINELRTLRDNADRVLQRKKKEDEEEKLKAAAKDFEGKWFVKYDKTMNMNAALVEDILVNPTYYHIKKVHYTGRGFINATYTKFKLYLEEPGVSTHLFEPKDDERYMELSVYKDIIGNIDVDDLKKEVKYEDVKHHVEGAKYDWEAALAILDKEKDA